MKKIFTLIAAALLGIGSMSAQTMTIKIDGTEVKNGDNLVITKLAKETPVGPYVMYDLGVDVEFKTLIAQTVATEGIDLSQVAPGLACCPTGFTCTTANASNGWTSTGSMTNLEAGREVNGEWIHYNYQRTKPADGIERKAQITFKGASETISFGLTIKVGDPTGINEITVEENESNAMFNLVGQPVGNNAKGIVVKNGKKYIAK